MNFREQVYFFLLINGKFVPLISQSWSCIVMSAEACSLQEEEGGVGFFSYLAEETRVFWAVRGEVAVEDWLFKSKRYRHHDFSKVMAFKSSRNQVVVSRITLKWADCERTLEGCGQSDVVFVACWAGDFLLQWMVVLCRCFFAVPNSCYSRKLFSRHTVRSVCAEPEKPTPDCHT
jgi:hypothetical protein